MAYVRPILCRICDCPVAETGVRVSELDADKLGNWWVRQEWLPKIELDAVAEFLESHICQFCLWDARSRGEVELEVEEFDWWTGHDTNIFYKEFFYEDDVIQPCMVRISPLRLPKNSSESPGNLESITIDIKTEPEDSETPKISPTETHDQEVQPVSSKDLCSQSETNSPCTTRSLRSTHSSLPTSTKPSTGQDKGIVLCKLCLLPSDSAIKQKKLSRFVHKQYRRFQCHLCEMLVRTTDLLWNHMLEAHPECRVDTGGESNGSRKIYCSCRAAAGSLKCCDEVYLTPAKFASHVGMIKCVYCSKIVTKTGLGGHIRQVHKSELIRCDICRRPCQYFLSQKEKEQHMKVHHSAHLEGVSERYIMKCPHCPLRFEESDLLDHVLSEHKDCENSCGYTGCNYRGDSLQELIHHTMMIHLRVVCVYCRKMFSRQSFMHEHVEREHASVKLKCTTFGCFEYFLSETDLKDHLWKIHKQGPVFQVPKGAKYFVYCPEEPVLQKTQTKLASPSASRIQTITMEPKVPPPASTYLQQTVYAEAMRPIEPATISPMETVQCKSEGCGLYFITAEERRKHISSVHMKVKCNCCENKFGCEDDLRDHVRLEHLSVN